MTEQRKASDILLGLEAEFKFIKSMINNQDNVIKILLNNVNKTNEILNSLIETQPLTSEQRLLIRQQLQPQTNNIASTASIPIEVETEFKGQRRVTRTDSAVISTKASNANIEFKDYLAQKRTETKEKNNDKAAARIESAQSSQKKIPVTQRVQDNNNKDLFMAEVNILSPKGELVLKTKTNAMGKWQAQLSPGNYIVKASKMDTALNKKIDAQKEITVSNSNKAITLSTLIINRE